VGGIVSQERGEKVQGKKEILILRTEGKIAKKQNEKKDVVPKEACGKKRKGVFLVGRQGGGKKSGGGQGSVGDLKNRGKKSHGAEARREVPRKSGLRASYEGGLVGWACCEGENRLKKKKKKLQRTRREAEGAGWRWSLIRGFGESSSCFRKDRGAEGSLVT